MTAVLFAWVIIPITVLAHPADNWTPNPLTMSMIYGTPLSIPDSGELKFDFDFTPADQLTAKDQYMLAGARRPDGNNVNAWSNEVMYAAISYYGQTGEWPAAITDEVIDAYTAGEPATDLRERLKSPLTARYPRLDAIDYSPGDMYLQPISSSQDAYLSSHDSLYRKLSGESDLTGNKFYLRLYGSTGVLAARYIIFSSGRR
jgi:hypothetical protein